MKSRRLDRAAHGLALALALLAAARCAGPADEERVMGQEEAVPLASRAVSPKLTGPLEETAGSAAYRSAGGSEDGLLERHGYQRQEYFIEGDTGAGPYRTRLLVTRPRDPAKFSGVLVVEIFQTSVWLQVREYLLRSGHGWAMISSRGNRWLPMLQAANPQRYADLRIPPDETNPEILAQAVGMLRGSGPGNPLGAPARAVILSGYSGDGAAVRIFLDQHHAKVRLPDGRPLFDGYYVAGTAVGSAPTPIADIELPVVELMNENEMIRSFERGAGRLAYRREDGPKYRLYEIAGAGHIGTRGDAGRFADACLESPLSDLPMNHLYSALFSGLVRWLESGVAPPRAERVAYLEDGKTIRRDEHGNTVGGVRSSYLDVPLATYVATSQRKPGYRGGFNRCEMIAHRIPFARPVLEKLHGSPEAYARRVAERVDQLVRDGWLLEADAAEVVAEARRVRWPE